MPNLIKNRYFLSAVVFCLWISFFDTNSVIVQRNKNKEIKKIKEDVDYYNEEIKQDQKLLDLINSDSLTYDLEKYFREVLFLSKKNEEVFIVE